MENNLESRNTRSIFVRLDYLSSYSCALTGDTHTHIHTRTYTWRNRGLSNERNSRDFAVLYVTSCFTKLVKRTSLFFWDSRRAIVIQVHHWIRRHWVKVDRATHWSQLRNCQKKTPLRLSFVSVSRGQENLLPTHPSWYLLPLPSCSDTSEKLRYFGNGST